MRKVAAQYPKGTVHIIWDNLNIHYDGPTGRWSRFNRRNGGRFVFHYTPKHASWVNQVEMFFSIVHRQCLRNGDFHSVAELRRATVIGRPPLSGGGGRATAPTAEAPAASWPARRRTPVR
jgi:transposase